MKIEEIELLFRRFFIYNKDDYNDLSHNEIIEMELENLYRNIKAFYISIGEEFYDIKIKKDI